MNIKIELLIYNEFDGSFHHENYFISELGTNINLSFVKKNIENIFCLNGLIDPVHEPVVLEALK